MNKIKIITISLAISVSTMANAFTVNNPFKEMLRDQQNNESMYDVQSQEVIKKTTTQESNDISDSDYYKTYEMESFVFESFKLSEGLTSKSKREFCFINAKEIIDVYRTSQYDLETSLSMLNNSIFWVVTKKDDKLKIIYDVKKFSNMDDNRYNIMLNKLTNKLRNECNKKGD